MSQIQIFLSTSSRKWDIYLLMKINKYILSVTEGEKYLEWFIKNTQYTSYHRKEEHIKKKKKKTHTHTAFIAT